MTGDDPLERLREIPVPSGGLAVSWLGQSGFILRTPATTALVDPFLAPYEGREYESSLAATHATGIDAVLISHEHVDHFDADSAPALANTSPGATFVVPTPIVDMVTESGVPADRVLGMQPGDPIELAGMRIQAIRAKHGVTMEDAYTFGEELSGGLVRFLGFVVEANGVRLYHAGDTLHYEGMEDALRDLSIDIALLPINGRDADREAQGILGNLSEREAAGLAQAIGVEVVVPMHYDLFARNRGYPEWFVESVSRDHPGVHVMVPTREAPFVLRPARR